MWNCPHNWPKWLHWMTQGLRGQGYDGESIPLNGQWKEWIFIYTGCTYLVSRQSEEAQSFPNPVGPSDLTGIISAGPGENWISLDQMSSKLWRKNTNWNGICCSLMKKPIITSILCEQTHIEPQIIYQNSFNPSFLSCFFHVAVTIYSVW